ncbi:D-alanyl-D-alanine carboxypeptidase/D-alanyl-D-alanine-endopeptidase [Boudabousia liubingyangii]|uniref:D-alanyl-D-alanine carboxypeptidase/D-alanyl-D-alanine-endopeptidase n=1 Tax=Boudabousia liubingyangii TaxID=1921764 RepID=A0A1Q5PLR2_9ACTO|nr:D-alanyl-D-alanine carboxypeptidase/D-alanyl-D-alanine-endopeptidase [Boudabousia liubingyangii]OKL46911.1 D-alanyl-D-alanine carboxypeptidase/D-alanyl-D-alanine-endopeptidase [Boudabousia liubingyangii]OKL47980.1 D-alanyl-D-alanine carboxypeptidase/D-alanyl-D-alanine-endopeptidase [Boudabousia liubingyangii]
MQKRQLIAALSGAALALGMGGYLAADAYDAVPGFLTLKPAPQLPPVPTPEAWVPYQSDQTPEAAAQATPAEAPSPEQLAPITQKLENKIKQAKGKVAIVVTDTQTGQNWIEINAKEPMIPASTTKLYTISTAAELLPPDGTFKTETYLSGHELYLKSNGDLLLSADKGGGNQIGTYRAAGYAGLGDLARQTAPKLKKLGAPITLVLDDTAINGPERNGAWGAQGIQNYSGNTTDMAVLEGRTNPQKAQVFNLYPQAQALRVFADALKAEGISIANEPDQAGPAAVPKIKIGIVPDGLAPLASVTSDTNENIWRFLEKTSDNTLSEQYCRILAGPLKVVPNYEAPAQAMVNYLKQQGVNTEGVSLKDCSGLNHDNRVTAASLTSLLNHDLKNPKLSFLPTLLPVSGWDGTLTNRMIAGQAAAGQVRAKTGSLPGVSALAGYLRTQDGHLLSFALLADNFEEGAVWEVRGAMDQFLNELSTVRKK